MPIESKAYELVGEDGATHFIWAFSDQSAIKAAARWGRRHGGCKAVAQLTPIDNLAGCWDRATRREVVFA